MVLLGLLRKPRRWPRDRSMHWYCIILFETRVSPTGLEESGGQPTQEWWHPLSWGSGKLFRPGSGPKPGVNMGGLWCYCFYIIMVGCTVNQVFWWDLAFLCTYWVLSRTLSQQMLLLGIVTRCELFQIKLPFTNDSWWFCKCWWCSSDGPDILEL